MRLLFSRSDTFIENHPDVAGPDILEITVNGNPLLTYNELRAGSADPQNEGDGTTVTVWHHDKDAWQVNGMLFSDVEVIG